MTVCVAALYRHDKNKVLQHWGIATVSDRMLTRGQVVEYEPPTTKTAELVDGVMLLVAGNMSVHSEAIDKTRVAINQENTKDVERIAELYAAAIRAYRLREATHLYLSPLGLTPDRVTSIQNYELASELAGKMQTHAIEVEAIIGGFNEGRYAQLKHVDAKGFVTSHEDVGFISIGIGADYADFEFMSRGFTPEWREAETLLLLHSAKQRAEAVAGVGPHTDMMVLLPGGQMELVPPLVFEEIGRISKETREQRQTQNESMRMQLVAYIKRYRGGQDKPSVSDTMFSKDHT